MQYVKGLGIGCALVFLMSASAHSQEATQPGVLLKPAKERGTMPLITSETVATETTSRRALSVCISDWDAATHMTRQEWRRACERSVKDYPDAFRQ